MKKIRMNHIIAILLTILYIFYMIFPDREYSWILRLFLSCTVGYSFGYIWCYNNKRG
jgi:hypothetical protein